VARADRTTVVLAYPPLDAGWVVERLRAVDDAVDVLVAPYEEPPALRVRREQDPHGTSWHADVPTPPTQVVDALARADVVVTLDLPRDVVALAPRLRWVHAISSGTGHLASCGLDRAGVALTSSGGAAATGTAEFVLARLLEHWKRLPEIGDLQRRHRWAARHGVGLAGRRVTVVGFGAIGTQVARMCGALGMEVTAVKRDVRTAATGSVVVVGADGLLDAVRGADAVVVAATGEAANAGLVGAAELAAMAPGSIVVNVARGALVDEEALVGALRHGPLGAAAIDVTAVEPLPPDSPLWDEPGVRVSAHCSAVLDGYLDRVVGVVAARLATLLAGGHPDEPARA
jgi:phosphoglycerate dehydrogenase-like enzyme